MPPSDADIAATVDTPVTESADTNVTTPQAARVFILDVDDDAAALETSNTAGAEPDSDALDDTNTSLVDAFEGLEPVERAGASQSSANSGDVFSR